MVFSVFKDKVLMITGGTGSFGNTVLERFLSTDLKEIVVFSRDEKKQEDMRLNLNSNKIKFILGDVRDSLSILQAMQGVDFVFHAAALKQVPSCEFHPLEAVKTNIIGTENVLNAAVSNRVSRVVVLSTDKAVYPINAMGISKAMAEKLVVAKARALDSKETTICATRYGNVMASRGSVIPLFSEALLGSRPLTITDPAMTRFLMSLEDSVDLVLHAFEHGDQGDIFVQKSPACTVEALAIALSELFNKKLTTKVIGTRHGEKLFETLVSREEMAKAIDVNRYWKVPADNRNLNYESYITEGEPLLNDIEDYTSHNTKRLQVPEVKDLLLKLPYIQHKLRMASQDG